jgi:alpha/beta superfamily hydrolase
VSEQLTLHTPDGLALEAERQRPPEGVATRAAAVLCHPHPQFGGSMRAVVVSPLFSALPALGVDCLRFNFRGVEGSQGESGDGSGEHIDALAAVAAQRAASPTGPLLCCGFSYGADVALSVLDAQVDAWAALAPPLHFGVDAEALARDQRPKLVVLAQHDDFRDAQEVAAVAQGWPNTRVEIVGGASHFFVGRTDRVIDLVGQFIAALVDGEATGPRARG